MLNIYSGFPGVGKTHFCEQYGCSDSDSSKFDKDNFPGNYIRHIKGLDGIVFVSSHREVREALVAEGMWFTLIYPHIELKMEYLERYLRRGSEDAFIQLLDANWETWLEELMSQRYCDHIVLAKNQFVSDVVKAGG